MARPCVCDEEKCRVCWLYHNDKRYKELFDSDRLDSKKPGQKSLKIKSGERRPCGCKKSR